MNEKEQGEYITELLTNEPSNIEGLEAEIVSRARKMRESLRDGASKLQNLRNAVVKLEDQLKNMQGRFDGYVEMLIDTESERRQIKVEKINVKDLPKALVGEK